jgi:hypothetical protein
MLTQASSKFFRHGFGSCGVKYTAIGVVGVDVVGERSGEHLVGSIAEGAPRPAPPSENGSGQVRGCIYCTCKQKPNLACKILCTMK